MSLYTQLTANVLFPLHERMKGHNTIEVFRSMEKTQWLSPEQLAQSQLQRLREFLTHIGQKVPYYRELFSRLNFDPEAVFSLQDLQRLPLMDKPEIRANIESLKAEGARDLQKFNTGGSSGEPLIFYLGKERISHDVAAKRRATRWWGVDIGDTEIVVWGSPIELGSQDRIRLLRDKFFRTELLSAFEMSEANLLRFVKRIQKIKPQMLFGYPSSLALIAEYAASKGYQLNDLGVKVVFVTSERLYDHQRQVIECTFGCPVANGYGGRDAGFIAHQCPKGSLHITTEDIIVEIVNENDEALPHGEKGEIIVTHLSTSEFPFVRYRTGDVGSLGSEVCPCGRGLTVLVDIEGRTTDFVKAADGTVLHGLALIYVLRDLPQVEKFKIIQESIDTFTVQLVTQTRDKEPLEKIITDQFRHRLGGAVLVNFDHMAEIQREASGKFRYVISKVGH
jgi:phenylacetate-coenzyme A ligase PaaK-like adenylate-forming protein